MTERKSPTITKSRIYFRDLVANAVPDGIWGLCELIYDEKASGQLNTMRARITPNTDANQVTLDIQNQALEAANPTSPEVNSYLNHICSLANYLAIPKPDVEKVEFGDLATHAANLQKLLGVFSGGLVDAAAPESHGGSQLTPRELRELEESARMLATASFYVQEVIKQSRSNK